MKKLLILSGKGGTGKTTITNALIELFHPSGFADCGVDAPNLHLLRNNMKIKSEHIFYGMKLASIDHSLCIKCGLCYDHCAFSAIHKNEDFSINPFACDGCGLCERICPAKAIHMIDKEAGIIQLLEQHNQFFSTATLNIGSGNSGLLVTEVKKQLKNIIKSGLIIIDGSPGIGCPVIASLSEIDACLMVSEPTVSGFNDLKRIVITAQNVHPMIFVCVNKYDINKIITKQIEAYCEKEKLAFIGKIPYDSSIAHQQNQGNSVMDSSTRFSKSITSIYLEIKSRIGEYEI
jgi:MinD superfamily P-loop ATPase